MVIVLKKKGVCSTKDFHHISLCNVLYKFITKVVANRLRIVLDTLIIEQQNAFIPRPSTL